MISHATPEALLRHVAEERLVDTARALVDIPSPTGHELEMAQHMRALLAELGMSVAWQEVEEGRPNVVGTHAGAGGGPSLMFNGHMDTSYSGSEPHLTVSCASDPEQQRARPDEGVLAAIDVHSAAVVPQF